jgi:hypothetical protein
VPEEGVEACGRERVETGLDGIEGGGGVCEVGFEGVVFCFVDGWVGECLLGARVRHLRSVSWFRWMGLWEGLVLILAVAVAVLRRMCWESYL